MTRLFLGCVSLAAGLSFAGMATAQDLRELICQPIEPNATAPAYNIECRIVDGEIEEGCACQAGFLLVDPEIQPAIIPIQLPSPG